MNTGTSVYFSGATLEDDIRSGNRSGGARLRLGIQLWQAIGRFHHFSDGWNVPCTAVDSTFQVLLCSVRNVILYSTAQMTELLRSPFRATV
jgi:low affinity Fe/Cu permease